MQNERLKILCEQASTERDPNNLPELVEEIKGLLVERRKRLTEDLFGDPRIAPRHTKQKRASHESLARF